MNAFDLIKFLIGIVAAIGVFFLSWRFNYDPLIQKENAWKEELKKAQELYDMTIKVRNDYEKYQKIAEEYEKLKEQFFPSMKEGTNEMFMSTILKSLEEIVTRVRNESKDKDFKLNNISFGTISNRSIGSGEEGEGIAVRSTEITMSLSGKYATVVRFIKALSDINKIGALIRIKNISFSPTSREVGKSPVSSISITLEMLQIIR
ncbi:MAG: hypothetical protein ABDH21_03335 [bacterium]